MNRPHVSKCDACHKAHNVYFIRLSKPIYDNGQVYTHYYRCPNDPDANVYFPLDKVEEMTLDKPEFQS